MFCMQINVKVSYKLKLSFYVDGASHAKLPPPPPPPPPQKKKCAIFLQYLKKEVKNDIDCLHENSY